MKSRAVYFTVSEYHTEDASVEELRFTYSIKGRRFPVCRVALRLMDLS